MSNNTKKKASGGAKGGKRNTSETIDSLNAKDVHLGRGQHVKHSGNHDFVMLVRANAVEYTSCGSKGGKDAIARRIIRHIVEQGGRFVRQTETSNKSTPLWEIADEKAVLIKVKQTFRDYSAVLRKAARRGGGRPETRGSETTPLPQLPVEPATTLGAQTQALIPVEPSLAAPTAQPPPPPLAHNSAHNVFELLRQQMQQIQQQQQIRALVDSLSNSSSQLMASHYSPILSGALNASLPPLASQWSGGGGGSILTPPGPPMWPTSHDHTASLMYGSNGLGAAGTVSAHGAPHAAPHNPTAQLVALWRTAAGNETGQIGPIQQPP